MVRIITVLGIICLLFKGIKLLFFEIGILVFSRSKTNFIDIFRNQELLKTDQQHTHSESDTPSMKLLLSSKSRIKKS